MIKCTCASDALSGKSKQLGGVEITRVASVSDPFAGDAGIKAGINDGIKDGIKDDIKDGIGLCKWVEYDAL